MNAEELQAARENPAGLASILAGKYIELHRSLATGREQIDHISEVDESVRRDLNQANLSSSTAKALRQTGIEISNLVDLIQNEIVAGHRSLVPGSQNRAASANLVQEFNSVLAEWSGLRETAENFQKTLAEKARADLSTYEADVRHMQPGDNSLFMPAMYPQVSYIGDQLFSGLGNSRPWTPSRWLGQVKVLPEFSWARIPWVDFCERNLVFVPDGSNLPYETACRAVQGIVTDQMSRSAPNCLKITWIDVRNGQSAGPFLSLANRGSAIIDGQVWNNPTDIEDALTRVLDRMADLERSCLQEDFPNLNAYNAQVKDRREANHVLVVTGYPHGFRESSAQLLQQIIANGVRVGVSVLVVMDISMASIVNLVDSGIPSYAGIDDGAGPVDPPSWWSQSVLPIGQFILGYGGTSYTCIGTLPSNGSAWVPCDLHFMDKATQSAIIDSYARASHLLTSSGLSPRESAAGMQNPAIRTVTIRNAMMKWLHDQFLKNERPRDWNEFLRGVVSDRSVSRDEIERNASYLYDQGYIVAGMDSRDSTGLNYPRLTPAGEDAALRGDMDIDQFSVNSGKAGSNVHNTTNINNIAGGVRGNQVAIGVKIAHQTQGHVTQIPDEFVQLVGAVEQILAVLPRLGLSPQDSEDVAMSADDALTEAQSSSPDQGKIRRALKLLKSLLVPVANGTATGVEEEAREFTKAALAQLQDVVF